MTRILLVLTLTISAATVTAADWPWQDEPEERLDYCKGFIVGGLVSEQVAGADRVSLWRAWSYLIRSDSAEPTLAATEYLAGQEQFKSNLESGSAQSVMEQANGSCRRG